MASKRTACETCSSGFDAGRKAACCGQPAIVSMRAATVSSQRWADGHVEAGGRGSKPAMRSVRSFERSETDDAEITQNVEFGELEL